MFLYRDHRGTLKDSMKTVQEFQNKHELLDYLQTILDRYGLNIKTSEIKVEEYGYDGRIKWDTHIVTHDEWGVFGFTNSEVG